MTLEEKVLRNDPNNNYNDDEIEEFKHSIWVYRTYEECEKTCLEWQLDSKDIPELWQNLDVSVADGVTYKYDLIL